MPTFFKTAAAFRAWLKRHAATEAELIVGLYKKETGQPSITWPEAVDEALCFGWIDGVRQTIDSASYQIRFAPRKPGSTWSAVNIRRMQELEAEGRVTPAGRAAFARRSEKKSQTYSYEQAATATLAAEDEATFRQHKAAWTFFESLPASYRKKVIWWIISAKQAETRKTRLKKMIDAAKKGKRL